MRFDFSKDRTRAVENAVARLFEWRSDGRRRRTTPIGVSLELWLRVVIHDGQPDTGDRGWSGRQGARRGPRFAAGGDSMASKETRTVNEHFDEVERATEATRRGIDRLVQLLASEVDDVVIGAIRVMDDLGARAVVGPMAVALPLVGANLRGFIVYLLGSYAQEEKLRVLQALYSAREGERVPWVADLIEEVLQELRLSGDAPWE